MIYSCEMPRRIASEISFS